MINKGDFCIEKLVWLLVVANISALNLDVPTETSEPQVGDLKPSN